MALDPRETRRLQARLLARYDRGKRDLPWRKTRDPYRIWISEIMLQQTQVQTVLPYYERFIRRFPTVRSLARADLSSVLALWAGLGYYARARNLHRAAAIIDRELGGEFPRTVEGLRRLPGIGDYTSAAVASIAFGVPAAVVDGNVKRVFARLHDWSFDVAAPRGHRRVQQAADRFLHRARSGDFNQALMELGATVCTPAAPRCDLCPLKAHCRALRRGTVARRPLVHKKKAVATQTHLVAAISHRDRWLAVRRPATGLWPGLWELPTRVCRSPTVGGVRRMSRRLVGLAVEPHPAVFCDSQHLLSHRRIRFVGFVCVVPADRPLAANTAERRWLTRSQLARLPLSTAMRRVIANLGDHVRRARLGL